MTDRRVLAAASFYSKSYFFDDSFTPLPVGVQKELQALLVEACEYTGGMMVLGFTPDGEVFLEATGSADDFDYDEIGAKYHVNDIIRSEEEFLQSLSLWYNLVMKELGK